MTGATTPQATTARLCPQPPNPARRRSPQTTAGRERSHQSTTQHSEGAASTASRGQQPPHRAVPGAPRAPELKPGGGSGLGRGRTHRCEPRLSGGSEPGPVAVAVDVAAGPGGGRAGGSEQRPRPPRPSSSRHMAAAAPASGRRCRETAAQSGPRRPCTGRRGLGERRASGSGSGNRGNPRVCVGDRLVASQDLKRGCKKGGE